MRLGAIISHLDQLPDVDWGVEEVVSDDQVGSFGADSVLLPDLPVEVRDLDVRVRLIRILIIVPLPIPLAEDPELLRLQLRQLLHARFERDR